MTLFKRLPWFGFMAVLFIVSGCGYDFEEMDSEAFKEKLSEGRANSAHTWWYIGRDRERCFIVRDRVIDKDYYSIDCERSGIPYDPMPLTDDEEKWINIKVKDIYS